MTGTEVIQWIEVAAAVVAVVGGLFAAYRFLRIKSRHERMAAIGDAFRSVMDALASDNEVRKLAGAILLRRFFNPMTELGIAGTPYADECVKVIAALLRDAQLAPNVQKLLADNLAYAPDLRNADLQRTRLQDAYLGDRVRPGLDLSGADFFMADLTKASLAGAIGRGTVFYRAVAQGTKFTRMDLTGANFREADLRGASFEGADLRDAQFADANLAGAAFGAARNVPKAVAERVDGTGRYP